MTIQEWLDQSVETLGTAGFESARLDALILLETVLMRDRSWILAHSEHNINSTDAGILDKFLVRRAGREPLAYITNTAWFWGRKFFVDKRVLIPRPESESFIELLKKIAGSETKIIDIGTGSGILLLHGRSVVSCSSSARLGLCGHIRHQCHCYYQHQLFHR